MPSVAMVGLNPEELEWLRLLVALLRSPDPAVGQLAREALRYVRKADARRAAPGSAGG